MNFEDWLNKNIHSYLSTEIISSLKNKYSEDMKKYEDKKDHNYIWELLSIYLDPITILKCGEVCWEWYRWSRSNITWLSKRNKLVALFPELLSLIDKDTKDNNHNTRMIRIVKRDVPRWSSKGCEVYEPPKGIYRLYSKRFLPIIQNIGDTKRTNERTLNLKKIKGSTFVPILVSVYRNSSFYRTLEDNEIINISSNWREKKLLLHIKKLLQKLF